MSRWVFGWVILITSAIYLNLKKNIYIYIYTNQSFYKTYMTYKFITRQPALSH